MNHITRHTLRWSLLLLVGSALSFIGCGSEDLDDPTYLAQINDSGMVDNKDKTMTAKTKNTMKKDNKGNMEHPKGREMMRNGKPGAPPPAQGEAAPVEGVGAVPVPAVPVIPVEVIQLPDNYVQLPPQVVPQPTIITQSAEAVQINQNTLYEQPVYIPMRTDNQHTINRDHHQRDILHTTRIEQQSFGELPILVVDTFSESMEVLPDTLVVEPPIFTPAPYFGGAVGGPVVLPPDLPGVTPFCAPWLSGGFFRFCRPYANGPFFR